MHMSIENNTRETQIKPRHISRRILRSTYPMRACKNECTNLFLIPEYITWIHAMTRWTNLLWLFIYRSSQQIIKLTIATNLKKLG